jgi:hypothetical protein
VPNTAKKKKKIMLPKAIYKFNIFPIRITVLFFTKIAVAQAYNPSYLGGWDQEDHGLGQPATKSYQDPISTNSWVW